MFALCVESSHQKGMGHLFRALNLAMHLTEKEIPFKFLINEDPASIDVLRQRKIPFRIVPLEDLTSDWESSIINDHCVKVWINDRLDTDVNHAKKVKQSGIKLVTFDDRGSGAYEADLHIAALAFSGREELGGGIVLRGTDYLVLDKELEHHKRIRTRRNKVVVSMGGADTYGVTPKIVEILKERGISATIIIGPSYRHYGPLEYVLSEGFQVKNNVHSLIEELAYYDLAITGGGITPFEACAMGLPCVVIATESHEIDNARYLEKLGCIKYAGYRQQIDQDIIVDDPEIKVMSDAGLSRLTTKGGQNVVESLLSL